MKIKKTHRLTLLFLSLVFCAAAMFAFSTPTAFAAEDTVWQNDYVFEKDELANTITLKEYRGNVTESLTVPGKATIDGKDYSVSVGTS